MPKCKYHEIHRMENTLGTIGLKYGTDKVNTHGYHIFYHDALKHLCDKKFNMMEIGVAGFNSVDMWKEYFPFTKVYGIDINSQYKDERLCIFKADQSDRGQLLSVISQMDGETCDFINDDGSHIPEHQILTFDLFFSKLLNEGGIYIIEDIETSYWKRNGLYGYPTRYGYGHFDSLIEKFKPIVDFINSKFIGAEDKQHLREKLKDFSDSTLYSISSITFCQNCIIIKKKMPYEYKYTTGEYRFANNV